MFPSVTLKSPPKALKFAICINNDGYLASLEKRKIYQVVADAQADAYGMLRVIDESGEDYLYPSSYFVLISLPKRIVNALALAV